MRYFAVVLMALGVGGLVYALSLRASEGEPLAVGFEPDDRRAPPLEEATPSAAIGPEPGYAYLQVLITREPSMRERLQGLVGVLVLLMVGMALVAATFYTAGTLIDRTIQKFLSQ
jgi:hypothetical protein